MTAHIVTKEEIASFNQERENNLGVELTSEELCKVLKKLNYAASGIFIKAMTTGENPPIVKIARGKYTFAMQPVHIQRLQQVWKDYRCNGRNRPSKRVDEKELASMINRAISLLKDNGYKVLKPVTQYEEV